MLKKILGFRKFIIIALILIVGIIFRISGMLNGIEFVELIKVCAVGFFGANLTEHITKAFKK